MFDYFLGTLFLIICALLIVVVLLQKGRGGGIGAAFGGAASSAFGTRVGDVFTWVTIVLTILFLLLAVGTTMSFRPPPDKVATPSFEPAPSDISETTTVLITCQTAEADIFYTTDGSTPEKGSANTRSYEDMVRVQPGQTIKARAYRSGGWTPSDMGYYGPPLDQPIEPIQTQPASVPNEQDVPAEEPLVPAAVPAG